MSKAVGVIVLLVLCASPAAAQQRQFGVKVGPTFPGVVFDTDDAEDDSDYGRRVAAAFGGFLVLPLNERFSAQFEALYIAKGAKLESDAGDPSVTLKLDYFEVPVLARVALTRTAKRSFFLFAGPSFAVRTNASVEDSVTVGGYNYGSATDVGVDFKRFDVGVIVGGGVDIGQWIVIDGRYAWGLTDINANDEIPFSINNRAFTFMAGVRF
jgi:hypothetical protein